MGVRMANGDPKTHPILQLADFFACATWIRSTMDKDLKKDGGQSGARTWLDQDRYEAGNTEI